MSLDEHVREEAEQEEHQEQMDCDQLDIHVFICALPKIESSLQS